MAECCFWHLFSLPVSWRGHTTYCRCGTLLVLRNGEWQSESVWREIDALAATEEGE